MVTKAKKRWLLLAKALKDGNTSDQQRDIFPFYKGKKYDSEDEVYMTVPLSDDTTVDLLIGKHSIDSLKLLGFDNTGNVQIWPCERVLAHVCLSRSHVFKDRAVLELGGGMTCLAGLLLGTRVCASRIHLTDGNEDCAAALLRNIATAKPYTLCPNVTSEKLIWTTNFSPGSAGNFDYVLLADCLYYETVHDALLQVLRSSMGGDGVTIAIQPRRAGSLQRFCDKARASGLAIREIEDFDTAVSDIFRHHARTDVEFVEDRERPVLLLMSVSADAIERVAYEFARG
eukprot:Clim_evm47s210 gene=Clim_evmTU47s210